jgi:hypothetical protein
LLDKRKSQKVKVEEETRNGTLITFLQVVIFRQFLNDQVTTEGNLQITKKVDYI